MQIVHQADMHMYCSIVRIADVSVTDEGTYEVAARNREGEATNTLVLNVRPKAEQVWSLSSFKVSCQVLRKTKFKSRPFPGS